MASGDILAFINSDEHEKLLVVSTFVWIMMPSISEGSGLCFKPEISFMYQPGNKNTLRIGEIIRVLFDKSAVDKKRIKYEILDFI